jgi:tripartite-type tricarboxylate transporter receptor subunit TctC
MAKLSRRKFLHVTAGAPALSATSRSALAQAYPSRPVRMLVPFAPGGPTDVLTRLVAQQLSERLGKQFFVENVAGAGGNIGTGQAARAAPDGCSILVTVNSHVINPTLYNKVS